MDLNQLQALPNGAKEHYAALGKVFDLKGWQIIVGRAKAEAQEAANTALCATSWEQFCFNRGRQLAFESFANFEDIAETEFAAIANEAIEQQQVEAVEDEGIME